jgi:hypothetical protein
VVKYNKLLWLAAHHPLNQYIIKAETSAPQSRATSTHAI